MAERAGRILRRLLRVGMWTGAVLAVVLAVVVASTWVWWRAEPSARQGSRG